MKKILWLPVAMLMIAALFVGCEKQVINAEEETTAKEIPFGGGVTKMSAENCGTCVNSWDLTRETIPYNQFNLSLVAEHNATGLTYLHLTRPIPTTFTKLVYTVTFTDVSASTTTTLLTQDDGNAAGGAVSDRDLLKDRPGVNLLPLSDFPSDWEKCDFVTVTFTEVGGVGFGNTSSISVRYYLRELCTTTVCTAYQNETAFGGTSAGAGNAWWYSFNTSVGAVQTIYAGQTINVGSVTFTGTSFEIVLTDGWELAPGTESVKVQGYNVLPSSRPPAGQFDKKGSSLTVDLTGYSFPYYIIHLDVRKCTSTE